MTCEHDWELEYPWQECQLCGLFEEAPEPDFEGEDDE